MPKHVRLVADVALLALHMLFTNSEEILSVCECEGDLLGEETSDDFQENSLLASIAQLVVCATSAGAVPVAS